MRELMIALLDGAFETPLWSSFLERLRHEAQAEFAILIFQPPGLPFDEAMHLMSGEGTGVTSVADSNSLYRQHFYPHDPLRRELAADGRPYSLAEILAFDGGEHAEFYHELTQGLGITAIREMRVQEASGVDAWLTIARRGPDFGEDADALLVQLAPQLRGALRHFVARERDRLTASLAAEAVGRLQFGWIALDGDGTVLDYDHFGETVLTSADVLYRNGFARLSAREPALDREIAKAIAGLAATPPGRPRALPLRAEPWLDMLLVPASRSGYLTQAAPSVIAYVHGDNWHSSERCAQLMDMFSLTTSEARLALALCRGNSIAESAAEVGLTIQTARSYSKAIYAKTGARGLPDLVRIIMGSVLALAR